MKLVPTDFDAEIERVAERLKNPTETDKAHWDVFEKTRVLIEDLRNALGPLSERQRQIIGLYMLAARRLGAGEDYEVYPPKIRFSVIGRGPQ